MPPSLRIQTVLYDTEPAGVRRLVASLAHGVRTAGAAVGPVALAVGDCSEVPVLTQEALGALPRAEVLGDVSYVPFGANLGHGGGHDRLAEGLAEDLLLVVNPDTVVDALLVGELAQRLAADPAVGIAEARQLPVEHPKDYDRDTGETGWASMACALLRGDAVREVGLFDADTFFLHGDDVDLSWRMRLAGWRVVHVPTARVFHDKAIGLDGYIAPGTAELLHGPLGALLLAHKYDRDDEVAALADLLRAGTEPQREALRRFERARERGLPRLPDPEGRVACFVAGGFAPHRF